MVVGEVEILTAEDRHDSDNVDADEPGTGRLAAQLADRSSAQIYAAATGALLVLLGVAALVTTPDFHVGSSIGTGGLLFLEVNAWTALLLLATGGVLLAAAARRQAARRAATATGVLFLLITLWGLFTVSVAWLIPLDATTAIFFAALAMMGLTAGLGPDPRES